MLLEGLHIPLTTPFHPDGRLHPHKLAANVIRYSKSPVQGLIALAPGAGEPTLLDDDETCEALRTIAEAAAPDKVLIANVSRDSVRATLALTDAAAGVNYDAILAGAPSFLRPGPREFGEPNPLSKLNHAEALVYFRAVADRSPLPVVLLTTEALQLSGETVADLATHPNIIGLLDATRSGSAAWALPAVRSAMASLRRDVTVTMTFASVTSRMLRKSAAAQSVEPALVSAASLARNPAAAATAVAAHPAAPGLRTRTRRIGFQVIAAAPGRLLESLGAGASALAPAFAACAPQACYEVFAAWKDGDEPLALEKQERVRPAAEFAETFGPGALKFGCDLNGYFGGLPRLPHLPLTGEQRAELQQHMSSLRT